tara:strand:+ start:433 stop:594 length:162 start_codon:yes stop_codon:yes gene_type:complete
MNASLEEAVRRSYYLALSMMFQSGESFQQIRKRLWLCAGEARNSICSDLRKIG